MLRSFSRYYRPHLRLFVVDFTCAVLSGALELTFPVAVKGFVDVLLPRGDWTLTLLGAAALLLVYAANTSLMVIVTYWGHVLGINIETQMRRKAFDHLQTLSLRFYDNQKTGRLVARITKDLEDIGEVAHHGPEDLFIAVMTFCGAFVLMFAVHPPLALIALAAVPIAALTVIRFGGQLAGNWRRQFERVGAFNARLEEAIGGIRVVKAFANEAHEQRLFAQDNAGYRAAKLDAYRIMASSQALNYFGMRLVQVAIMLAGAWFVVRGGLTIGGFIGFLLLVTVLYRPLEKIAAVLETYPKGIAGFHRYQELLAITPDIVDRPGAVEVPALGGDIRFEAVSFGYAADRPVLSGIDLHIVPGETVAFVGPSGAGKTTLLSLLPRFYDVDAGRVLVDGHDVRDLTLHSLRRQIGLVSQDVFLFAGTLRENIAYGRLDATGPEIEAAARRARLDAVIAGLPDGLDTVVGERGIKLSGGQRQRVAIARIFLKNPPILILDEATSALDTETERAIQDSLDELAVGRTTLIIAHRLATIRHADRIVVVTQAGIAEQGRHDDLLGTGGAYAALHRAQSLERRRPRPA